MEPRLSIRGVTKSFGAAPVLTRIDLDIEPGSIVALLGTNGAGKSTLMKILAGVHAADAGEIHVDGSEVTLRTPVDAIAQGIRLLPQEISIIPDLTVAENILLGDIPTRRLGPVRSVDWPAVRIRAQELLHRVGLQVSPSMPVRRLTTQQMRLVEIARALAGEARVLILDEPTASLTKVEVEELFVNLRRLKAEGVSIIYISHHIDEVFRIADTIAVLRDGRVTGRFSSADAQPEEVIAAMLGRVLDDLFPPRPETSEQGEVALEFRRLVLASGVGPLDFSIRAGEIFGIYGLLGSGCEEIGQNLFAGTPRILSGEVLAFGRPLPATPRQRSSLGIGFVPAERKRDGVVPELTIRDNITLPVLAQFGALMMNRAKERQHAGHWINAFDIRATGPEQPVKLLSGGNQQKAVLARWVGADARILVCEDPTRGVDLGARQDIYRHLRAVAGSGTAVLLISSDVEEVAGLADRTLVLAGRRSAGILEGGTPASVLMAAASRESRELAEWKA